MFFQVGDIKISVQFVYQFACNYLPLPLFSGTGLLGNNLLQNFLYWAMSCKIVDIASLQMIPHQNYCATFSV